MRRWLSWSALAALTVLSGCKKPGEAEAEANRKEAASQLAAGVAALDAGVPDEAAAAFKRALARAPNDPTPYLLLSEARRKGGNDTAAILALRHALGLMHGAHPELQRKLAGLYLESGSPESAIAVLLRLRDAKKLSDPEILELARLQGRARDFDGAFHTLGVIQMKRPDDPEAKVVEAELLLGSGKELAATRIMDRLVAKYPKRASVRLLRAGYFLRAGYAQMAEADVEQIPSDERDTKEIAELRAKVLVALDKQDDAVQLLLPWAKKRPEDVQLLSELAGLQLARGKISETEALVDQVLALKPDLASALYVRARMFETQGKLDQAVRGYQATLDADPSFAPALTRLWQIDAHRGNQSDALVALQKLDDIHALTVDESATLAGMYLDLHLHLDRARELIDAALRHEPTNAAWLKIRKKLRKTQHPHHTGVVFINP